MNQKLKMIVADMFLTFLSIVLGLMLRLEIVYVGKWIVTILPFIILTIITRPAIFYYSGVYNFIWRYATMRDFARVGIAVLGGTVFLAPVTLLGLYPNYVSNFPRSLLFIEALTSLFFLGGFRVVLRTMVKFKGDLSIPGGDLPDTRKTLIVGAGSAGTRIAQELLANRIIGLRPTAFLDDDPKKIGAKIDGLKVFGPLATLPEVVKDQSIQEVVIAIPSAPSQTIQNVQRSCQDSGVLYSTMPSIASILETGSGKPSSCKIPMAMPDITSEEVRAVVKVMQSRNLSIGFQTATLEELGARVADARYGTAVINGTSALHLCMSAAGVGPGDEVITTPYSFIASSNCILFQNATPVFVDIDPITLNINPALIEEKITPRTKAILPVHVFGQPADMDPIMEIARRHNLLVIEDAAEAIGAYYKGRPVGAIGNAGIFAFYPNKQMTSGEGAVIATNDQSWDALFRSLRNQGRDVFDEWLQHSRLGYNYRMSELNAAVGVVQIHRLDELLDKRNNVAMMYNAALEEIEGVEPLKVVSTTTRMSWFVYVVRFAEHIDRNTVMKNLADQGIPARPYFSPIHLQPFYIEKFGFKPGDFPHSEAAGNSSLALPFHSNLNSSEIEIVVSALKKAVSC